MKEKAKDPERNPALESADEALKGYGQALRTGLKFQEETWQCWRDMLTQSTPTQDWQGYFAKASAAATGYLPAARKRMEEGIELMEKNTKGGADLMKKAVDATRAPTILESQRKWMEFWKDYLNLAQGNADAALSIGSRAVDSWMAFVQKNSEAGPAPKAG